MFHWSGDLVAEVAIYLKKGLSAAQIGAQIGVSRNAVIGEVTRDEKLNKIGFTQKRVKTFAVEKSSPQAGVKHKDRKPRLVIVATEPFQVAGKSILMLGSASECRWVVNDAAVGEQHLFCGLSGETGKHYCAHHLGALYQPRRAA